MSVMTHYEKYYISQSTMHVAHVAALESWE